MITIARTSPSQPLIGVWPFSLCAAWMRWKVVIVVQIAGTTMSAPGNSASVDFVGLSPSSFVPCRRP